MGGCIIIGRNINRVVQRFKQAGDKETLSSPQIIQSTKSVRHTGGIGSVRIAYCKTAAGSGTTIVCHLDTDGTGEEVTVYCAITGGGTKLNEAIPRLSDGDPIAVYNDQGTWRSVFPFQRLNTNQLDVVSNKFETKLYKCP